MLIAKTISLFKLDESQSDETEIQALLKRICGKFMKVRICYEQDSEYRPGSKIGSFDVQPTEMVTPQSPDSADEVSQYIMAADGMDEVNINLPEVSENLQNNRAVNLTLNINNANINTLIDNNGVVKK